jgi:hypothetical protein
MPTLKMFLGGGQQGISPTPVNISSNDRGINRDVIRNLGGTRAVSSFTPFRLEFNAASNNPKYVQDSSDYVRYKKLQAIKRTYNNPKL